MGIVHVDNRRVWYSEVDSTGFIKPAKLVSYMADFATDHSNKIGYGLDWYRENQKGWIILNWHIKIYQRPVEGDIVTLQTWARNLTRIQAGRSFAALNEKDDLCWEGESRWILLDKKGRKPSRLASEMMEDFNCLDKPPAFEGEKFDSPTPLEDTLISTSLVSPRKCDIDTVGHVNNIVYLEWALENIPNDIYCNLKLSDIKASYNKECLFGQEIIHKFYLSELGNGSFEATSLFLHNDGEKEILHSQVTTLWENKIN